MKTLIIYYSLTKNTKFIADLIVQEIGADILELKTKKQLINPRGFMKYFWGGKQVIMKEIPELELLAKNPEDYDLLIIGTPVWAWNFTPPLRAFFINTKLNGKKIALFCTHGGDPRKTLVNMVAELAGNEIIGQIDFREPLKFEKDKVIERAKEWAKNLVK